MKKLFIQHENDILCDRKDAFSLFKDNKKLKKNESNRKTMSCILIFSGIKIGVVIYFLYLSSFIIGIIGVINIPKFHFSINNNNDSSSHEQWPLVMTIAGFSVFGLTFIISLIRIISSDITDSLKNFRSIENQVLQDYINSIEESTVELFCKCECYHKYESSSTTTTTTTTTHNNTKSTTKKVVTYREEMKIPIVEINDLTNPLIFDEINSHCSDSKFLKVSFFRDWMPADEKSQVIIKSVVDHLTIKNEKRDTYFKIYLDFQYVDKKFKEHILFPLSSSSSPPFLFRYGFYILSLFVFMYLPFELYFRSKIYKSEFSFVKLINVDDKPIDFDRLMVIQVQNQTTQFQIFDNYLTLNKKQFNNKVLQKQQQNFSVDINF
ncbi:hypothetical protein RB653_009370 [Dictyostelium firmibasis]|uniref:Transmembrane protein n=1 Tax=Dictyostelium firmibasis TaxID=79012 RepID=A0AAN7U1S9_9MYCE